VEDSTIHTTHERLAKHLAALGMGLPATADLVEILQRLLTQDEAELLLALPTNIAPLQVATVEQIAAAAGVDQPDEIEVALDRLLARGLLYSGRTLSGERGYALLQAGFGFPQTFFWAGEESDEAREMAAMVSKYANRHVLREMYAATPTKAYRYVPLDLSLTADQQAVYPQHAMDGVLDRARTFAVAHCPCRVAVGLRGHACEHPLEVCLKFDELADYVVERGLARSITREEARGIVRASAEAGLVHFVDNALGDVKHNCNCCGDACWNVGTIRRRKIPRDSLMATYFLRTTTRETCSSCGMCAEVCPVHAVDVESGEPDVDLDWCIGCGVCVTRCADGAAGLALRTDLAHEPPPDFAALHRTILGEKSEA